MRRIVLAMIAVAATSGIAGSAEAQSFPSRPITMIVPFAAGGPTDVIARVIGERMGQSPLCNALRFARGVEAAYRQMWKRWASDFGELG